MKNRSALALCLAAGQVEFRSTTAAPASAPTSNQVEHRAVEGLELRDNGEGKMPTITGYAAVFNARSNVIWDFREVIKAGAFKASLDRGDEVVALIEHKAGGVIGRRSAGTLRLEEDTKGLKCEIDLGDTQESRDLVTKIKRKDVKGMSFGFVCVEDAWDLEPDGTYIRSLVKVNIIDVSPVTFPAYPQTELSLRSLELAKEARAKAQTDDAKARLRLLEVQGRSLGAVA